MDWQCKVFSDLSATELYEILTLRQRVFVVEQNCAYLDCDGHDLASYHLIGRNNGTLAAYLRILPPGLKFSEASLGRVVTAPEARGQGAGLGLTAEALRWMEKTWGHIPIRISAQAYLENFYAGFGFKAHGKTYLEDGIPHLEMLRS